MLKLLKKTFNKLIKNKKMLIASLFVLSGFFAVFYLIMNQREKFSQHNTNEKIVYFFMPDCPHCKSFSPTWELFKNRTDKVFPNLKFEKVNVTESPEIAERYAIKSFPTIVFMRNNVILDTYKYNRNLKDLSRWVENDLVKM